MKIILFTLLSLSVAFNVSANSIPNLDSVIDIPVEGLKAIEVNGQIMFMSNNGRYVMQGKLTDVWQKKELSTPEEIEYAATHINVDAMGLPVDKLNTITIGEGSKRVIVFVDPACTNCKSFVREAQSKTNDYTFKLIVVPALGDESHKLSKSLFCATEVAKEKAITRYLNNKLGGMKQKENCNTKYYDLSLMAAQQFNIKAVPYFIAPDGRHKPGLTDIWNWIEGK